VGESCALEEKAKRERIESRRKKGLLREDMSVAIASLSCDEL